MNLNQTITLPAPAKINLFLHILGKMDNGYHNLESLVGFSDIGDNITITTTPSTDITINITGEFAPELNQTPTTDNLIYKLIQNIKQIYPQTKDYGVDVILEKNLPVASGIGGGSSDCATTLIILNKLWQLDLNFEQLSQIVAPMGSDIVMCLYNKLTFAYETGNELLNIYNASADELIGNHQTVDKNKLFHVVLVNPLQSVSTGQIFKNLTSDYYFPYSMYDIFASLNHNDFDLENIIRNSSFNSLQPVACNQLPLINDIVDNLYQSENCILARMSGSGATCFALYKTKQDADKASCYIQDRNPGWWVKSGFIY